MYPSTQKIFNRFCASKSNFDAMQLELSKKDIYNKDIFLSYIENNLYYSQFIYKTNEEFKAVHLFEKIIFQSVDFYNENFSLNETFIDDLYFMLDNIFDYDFFLNSCSIEFQKKYNYNFVVSPFDDSFVCVFSFSLK